ncbi:MAG: hypothetical protein M3415_07710 [Actinomycetota bacterium]|jgi:hypothetical protein|nr:hypothetical protein [Actinomycetota bacterium]
MRCPNCAATNPDDASWCGQCFAAFKQARPDPRPAPTPAAPASPVVSVPAEPAGNLAHTSASESIQQLRTPGMRRRGDEVEWECTGCGEYHSIDQLHCDVCGASFADRFRPVEADVPPASWQLALVLSALTPGAGHVLLGRYGAGAARLLLFVVWLLGAFALRNGPGASAALVVAPLLLGVVALWVTALVDIQRLRSGRPVVLSNRALLWLVVAVVGMSLLGLFVAFVAISR